MGKKNPITWLLSVGSIIDERETKKTGIWLMFIGVLFIIGAVYVVIRDLGTSNFNWTYPISFFCTGIVIVIIGEILRRKYFR